MSKRSEKRKALCKDQKLQVTSMHIIQSVQMQKLCSDNLLNTFILLYIFNVPFTFIWTSCQAKNLSNKFPKKKLVLPHPFVSGALELVGTFFTLNIVVCPISLRSASIVFMSTGLPEESLT